MKAFIAITALLAISQIALAQYPCQAGIYNQTTPSCASCGGSNRVTCTSCLPGFWFTPAVCIACIDPNAYACDQASGITTSCKQGYALTNNLTCIACVANCGDCSSTSGVTQVYDNQQQQTSSNQNSTGTNTTGWYNAGDVYGSFGFNECQSGCANGFNSAASPGNATNPMICVANSDANCRTGSNTASSCTACNAGFSLTAAAPSTCTACPAKCPYACAGTTQACNGPSPGGLGATLSTPSSCAAGYAWTNTAASPNNDCVANATVCTSGCAAGWCVWMNSTTAICQQAATGYYLAPSNVPTACGANCKQCDSARCYQCQSGFGLLFNGTCQACPGNCTSCDGTGICTACSSGYFLPPNQCPPCPANCTVCVNNTLCGTGNLSTTNQTSVCNKGYTFNNVTFQCLFGEKVSVALASLVALLAWYL